MTIVGDAFVEVRPNTDNFGSELKTKVTNALKNPVVIAGAALATATAAVTALSNKSIDRFEELGGTVKGLMKLTGSSAESMSHLAFAARETGVSTDALGVGFKTLSLNISKNNEAISKAGIAYKDAKGGLLPLDVTLANVAEKFKSMPNGIEKNTLAVKLFGRSGVELIPVLNKGRDGLAELADKADKYGLTLSGANLDAIKKNKEAHKDFNAAVEGLEVQIGSKLLPVLTSMTLAFNSEVIPVILDATHWVDEKLGPAFDRGFALAEKAGRTLVGFMRDDAYPWLVEKWHAAEPTVKSVWATVEGAFGKAEEIARTKLLPGLKDIWDWLENHVLPAAENVANKFNNNLLPAIGSNKSAAAIWGVAAAIGGMGTALADINIPDALLTPGGAFVATIGALAAAFGDWDGKVKALKTDFQPVIDAVTKKPQPGHMMDNEPDTPGGGGTLSISEGLKKVDWNKVGEDAATFLSTAIAGAATGAQKIAEGIATLMGKIDWYKLGTDVGKTAVPFVLGFIFNLLNFDIVGVLSDHWFEILIGAIALALAPARWIKKLAELLEEVPFVGSLLAWILNKSVAVSEGFFNAALKVLSRFFDGFIEGIGAGKLASQRLGDWFFERLADLGIWAERMFSGGGHLVQRLIDGILGMIGGVAKAIGQVVLKVAEALKLPDLFKAGEELIQSLINGITSKFKDVKSTLGDLTGKITDWKGPPARDAVLLQPAGQVIIEGLIAGIESRVPSLRNQLESVTRIIGTTGNLGVPDFGSSGTVRNSQPAAVNNHFHLTLNTNQSDADIQTQFQRMKRLAVPVR